MPGNNIVNIDWQSTARGVMEKAKSQGDWIYNPENKRWYTPEEFAEVYAQYYTTHPIFRTVKLMKPQEGLVAGYTKISELQNKLFLFAKKITDYYQSK